MYSSITFYGVERDITKRNAPADMAENYLIVDDAPTVRMMLQRMLQEEGVDTDHVLVADSGEEALELFRTHDPHVVFMDIHMPGMDGEQAASTILLEDPMTKLVVVTGSTRDDEEVRRLISLGAYEFLAKPIRREDIRNILRLIEAEEGRTGRIK